jgi:MFS family permease
MEHDPPEAGSPGRTEPGIRAEASSRNARIAPAAARSWGRGPNRADVLTGSPLELRRLGTPCERPEVRRRRARGTGGWPVVAASAITAAVGAFDVTGVNVVLPRIAADLRVDAAAVQWVVLAYLLPIAALALPAGRWLDTVGRRQALFLLVAGFALAAAGAGAAPGLPLLIGTRAVQGVFGAGLFAIAPIVAFQALPPADRRTGVGLVSAAGAAGGVAGPALGALVTQAWGWPWIFWLTIPLLVVQLPVLARSLPPGAPLTAPTPSLLVEGALIGAATGVVLLGLTFTAGGSPLWLLVALAAGPLAVLWYRLHPDAPATVLLRRSDFALAAGSRAFLAAAVLSAQFLLVFVAERTMHLSTGTTGGALLALPGATVVGALVAARLPSAVPPTRTAALGFAVIAAGAAAALAVSDLGGLLCAALLIGLGQGLANTPATHLAMSVADARSPGSTGAALSFLWNLGSTVGPACVTAIWGGLGYAGTGMSAALVLAALFAVAGGGSILLAGRAAATERP